MGNGRYRWRPGLAAIGLMAAGALAVATSASGERASQPGSVQSGYLDAGYYHTCAVVAAGNVRCWGMGVNGQLGYGSTADIGDNEVPGSAGPVSLGSGRTATQVGAGESRSCALLDNGTIRCWGSGGFGGLGYASTEDVGDNESVASKGPVNLGSGHTAKVISVGNQATCAIRDDDKLLCWGQAGDGALGYANENSVGDNETPGSIGPVNVGTGRTVKAVSTGGAFTCAILDNGAVRCWGLNDAGQLGYGNTATYPLSIGDDPGEEPANFGPVDLGGLKATAIATGSKHACVILEGGSVKCWGEGTQGKLGYGNTNNIGDNETPAAVGAVNLGGHAAVAITAADQHSCALLDDGSVRCWGGGFAGRTGLGTTDAVGDQMGEVPLQVTIGQKATAISAGAFHTCARRADNSVICWGQASQGKLGYGSAVTADIGDNEAANSGGAINLGPAPPPPPLDSDGDGKPNPSDVCPNVAGATTNGCPNIARTLTIKYRRGAFRGALDGSRAACLRNQTVTVYKKVGRLGGRDDRTRGTDATDNAGAWALSKRKRSGTYYATVPAKTIATAGNCLGATSATTKIK